jgi:hypothetical protein
VPKNSIDPDDPMQLHGVALRNGDPMRMLDDILDEFVRIGYRERHLHMLFRDPHYQMTFALGQVVGAETVRLVVRRVLSRWGIPLDGPAVAHMDDSELGGGKESADE